MRNLVFLLIAFTLFTGCTEKPKLVTMKSIATDVAAGKTTYLDKTVTVMATVQYNVTTVDNIIPGMSLFPGKPNIRFIVSGDPTPAHHAKFMRYKEGETYYLTIKITDIQKKANNQRTISAILVSY